MSRRSHLSDVPAAWLPGGEVCRALYGDPNPRTTLDRIGSVLAVSALWAITLLMLGIPWRVAELASWLAR